MSIILNRPILILEDIYYEERKLYKKMTLFNNTDYNTIKIEEIIFINFQNNNHYELLTPKKNFIKKRINKITEPDIKQLIMVNNSNNQSNKNLNNLSRNNEDYKNEKTQEKNFFLIMKNHR